MAYSSELTMHPSEPAKTSETPVFSDERGLGQGTRHSPFNHQIGLSTNGLGPAELGQCTIKGGRFTYRPTANQQKMGG